MIEFFLGMLAGWTMGLVFAVLYLDRKPPGPSQPGPTVRHVHGQLPIVINPPKPKE